MILPGLQVHLFGDGGFCFLFVTGSHSGILGTPASASQVMGLQRYVSLSLATLHLVLSHLYIYICLVSLLV